MKKNKKSSTFSAFIDYNNGKAISPSITSFPTSILYLGENRNGSYFTEETVNKMISTLGGIAIVGKYDKEKKDFCDHGELVAEIDSSGEVILKNVGTVPYGFVPPNPKTWWEEKLDEDGVTRNYLMTDSFLWTGRHSELETLKEGLNNQSMELNPNTMEGEFTELGFVIKKAEFLGLCILGKDVEPCFEGAGFKNNFTLNSNFVETLEVMKKELKEALESIGDGNEEPTEADLNEIEQEGLNKLLTNDQLEQIDNKIDDPVEDPNEDIDYKAKYEELKIELDTLSAKFQTGMDKLEEYEKEKQKELKEKELKSFKEKMSKEDFSTLESEIEKYSLAELTAQAKEYAYKYMEELFSLHKQQIAAVEGNSFVFVEDEVTPCPNFGEDSWKSRVLKKQKEMEEK